MRSEVQIEMKIDEAVITQEQPHSARANGYIQGVRTALEWALGESDSIPGLDED